MSEIYATKGTDPLRDVETTADCRHLFVHPVQPWSDAEVSRDQSATHLLLSGF